MARRSTQGCASAWTAIGCEMCYKVERAARRKRHDRSHRPRRI